ncbi:hypothetical protein DFH09DRAFT_1091690 [Mycena vulgaris]|nr:hypothetical protein DFH09DRAFT_1091690 [Mycena vulgaris]
MTRAKKRCDINISPVDLKVALCRVQGVALHAVSFGVLYTSSMLLSNVPEGVALHTVSSWVFYTSLLKYFGAWFGCGRARISANDLSQAFRSRFGDPPPPVSSRNHCVQPGSPGVSHWRARGWLNRIKFHRIFVWTALIPAREWHWLSQHEARTDELTSGTYCWLTAVSENLETRSYQNVAVEMQVGRFSCLGESYTLGISTGLQGVLAQMDGCGFMMKLELVERVLMKILESHSAAASKLQIRALSSSDDGRHRELMRTWGGSLAVSAPIFSRFNEVQLEKPARSPLGFPSLSRVWLIGPTLSTPEQKTDGKHTGETQI